IAEIDEPAVETASWKVNVTTAFRQSAAPRPLLLEKRFRRFVDNTLEPFSASSNRFNCSKSLFGRVSEPQKWYPLFAGNDLARQQNFHASPLPQPRADRELAVVTGDNVLDDGKPEAGALLLAVRLHLDAVEAFGEAGDVLFGNSGAEI